MPTKPWTNNEGKSFTIHEWLVDGKVDGSPVSGVIVGTMSDPTAATVKEGETFECTAKEYRGETSYKLVPVKKAGGGFGGGGRPFVPPTSYTAPELQALYGWCIAAAAEELGYDISKPEKDPAIMTVVQSGAATLLIAAQKCGLKI